MSDDAEIQGKLSEEEEALLREFEEQRNKDKKQETAVPPPFMQREMPPEKKINPESGLTPQEEELLAEFENTRETASAARQREEKYMETAAVQKTEPAGFRPRKEEPENEDENTEKKIQKEIEAEILKAKEKLKEENKESGEKEEKKEKRAGVSDDIEDLKRKIEEETREKIVNEMREKIEKETREKYENYLRLKLENEIRSRVEKENSEKQAKILQTLEKIHEAESRKSTISEDSIKEKIKKEMEEERKKKQAALMSKIDNMKMHSQRVEEQKRHIKDEKEKSGEIALSHTDRLILARLFEETQKILIQLFVPYTDMKKAEKMFLKAADTAIKKNSEVLKKAVIDKNGRFKTDGSLEIPRIMANVNAYPGTEANRSRAFFKGLRDIFEERLIACEIATDLDTRERITSELMRRMTKVFSKNDYNKKMGKIFMEHIMPDTSLQSEDD
ncbi:MAG: hypothetical protein ACLFP1_04765 [Candidatus Goldiibacteriota bacterium]